MSAPSSKMLDKLTAAFTAVPCGGLCIVYNNADEQDEKDNFTTYNVENHLEILNHIPTLELARDMIQITNDVNRIKDKVYSR